MEAAGRQFGNHLATLLYNKTAPNTISLFGRDASQSMIDDIPAKEQLRNTFGSDRCSVGNFVDSQQF